MMKSKAIFIFLVCLAVSFSITAQARMTNGQHLFVSAKVIGDLKTTIDSEYKDMDRVKQLVSDARIELADFEKLYSVDGGIADKLKQELDYYKMISGAVDISGEGVTVTIDDGTRPLYEGEDPNNVLVHDADLLIVINELRTAGAEAIAVNGQRIVNSTEISCSGYTVRINDQFFARPFKIEAIGDTKRMLAVLVAPEGYGALLKDYGLTFKVAEKDQIVIKKIDTEYNYKYIQKQQ
jgi:uncharacterized protein YlxW (UPF0749 family)